MNALNKEIARRKMIVAGRWMAAVAASIMGCSGTAGPASDGAKSGPANVDHLELPGASFYPASIDVASDGTLYVGSVATGAVVKFAPGQTEATTFIAPGGSLKGAHCLIVDETTSSLFVCAIDPTFKLDSPPAVQRYDLTTGALKATFTFPDAPAAAGERPNVKFPNDAAFDGAHRLYITDSFGGNVYVVADIMSDAVMTAWSSDAHLAPVHAGGFGATGISWDGASSFYVNNNDTGALVKIPLNGDGTAGPVTLVTVTPPLENPVGQRQLDSNTLVLVENGALIKVALSAGAGTATVLDNRLDGPTSLVRFGSSFWVAEGQIAKLAAGKLPNLPFLVQRVDAY